MVLFVPSPSPDVSAWSPCAWKGEAVTIRIPLRFVAVVLYTCALCGASAATSYAVYRWQHDPYAERVDAELERLDDRGSTLRRDISALSTRVAAVEGDAARDRTCHVALVNLILYTNEALRSGVSPTLRRDIEETARTLTESCY